MVTQLVTIPRGGMVEQVRICIDRGLGVFLAGASVAIVPAIPFPILALGLIVTV
jgi:hypothetical protein